MNTVSDTLTPGTIIQDTYEITALLGEGGMGATFAGRNLATEHEVAIKVISSAFASNTRAIDLFKREANLLRTIQHDAVVRYETTLQDKEGRLYLVMEHLDGAPLSSYLDRRARLESGDVLRLGRRLAAGLDAIAAVGTVHRDIAPDNIFVPGGDILSAKLIDFGLASNTVGTDKSILGDDFAGKFSFCAPEQMGFGDGKVSPKTDAYALGLVLMKVAGLPVPGEGKGLGAGPLRRLDIEVPRDGISAALHNVLESLLKADPEDRPSPLTPLFEEALAAEGKTVPPRSEKTQQVVDRVEGSAGAPRRTGLIAIAAALAAAIAAGGYFMLAPAAPEAETTATRQAGLVEEALEADDPLQEARDLIAEGTSDSLNAAFGALLTFGRNADQPEAARIEALNMAAQMADPQTHASTPTPFDEPDPGLARRIYASAADLGSTEAASSAARLEGE